MPVGGSDMLLRGARRTLRREMHPTSMACARETTHSECRCSAPARTRLGWADLELHFGQADAVLDLKEHTRLEDIFSRLSGR